jgi:hypothetical protein
MYLQTTSYDYTAPLDEFGLETTKSQHLARLHRALWRYADDIVQNERAAPQSLGAQQAAFCYGRLTFVCNDDPEHAADVTFDGNAYHLAPRSAQVVAEGALLFDSANVHPDDVIDRTMQLAGALQQWGTWREPLPSERPDEPALTGAEPVEQLLLTHDESDYCWYSTSLEGIADPGAGTLTLGAAADYIYVYVDGQLRAHGPETLHENRSRTDGDAEQLRQSLQTRYGDAPGNQPADSFRLTFELDLPQGARRLDILCCALGLIKGDWQIGFENMAAEKKGLWAPVLWNGAPLAGDWALHPWLAGERFGVASHASALVHWSNVDTTGPLRWHRTTFERPQGNAPLALDLASMRKGLAWVNGRCLGRYWLVAGTEPIDPWQVGIVEAIGEGEPTQRYYHVPCAWLRDHNELIVLEEQGGDPAGIRLCRWSTAVYSGGQDD